MGQITGGSVTYRRVAKVAEYESKIGEAVLSFQVEEGEDHEAIFNKAANAARAKVFEMLGIVDTAGVRTSTAGDSTVVASEAGDGKGKGSGRGKGHSRPPAGDAAATGATAAAKADAAPAAVPADPAAMDVVTTQPKQEVIPPQTASAPAPEASAPTAAPADPTAMGDEWGAQATEVTDADLLAAIQKQNAKIKNAIVIRQLIGKYIAPPGQFRDIPQDKRSAFVAELEKL